MRPPFFRTVPPASSATRILNAGDDVIERLGLSRFGLRFGQGPTGRLTGRGGVMVVFGTCFLGLLIADWANWAELADAVFLMASSLTAYYVRPGSLLPVAVSPPILFFGAMALEKTLTASGMFGVFEAMFVTLADAAPWLFAGTALTVAIALVRGLHTEIRTLVLEFHGS